MCERIKRAGTYGKQLLSHEATVLSKLNHESMCFLFGIQCDSGPYCLIMNLYTVDGVSINVHDLICIPGWIDTSEQDLTTKQCVLKHRYATLHHVHGLGIIHRDLKTDNVVFYCHYDFLQPVIIDFGKSVYACSAKKFILTGEKKVEYRQNHKHIATDLVDGLVKPSPASDVYSFGQLFKNVICHFPLNVSELPSDIKDIVKLCLSMLSVPLVSQPKPCKINNIIIRPLVIVFVSCPQLDTDHRREGGYYSLLLKKLLLVYPQITP